MRKSVSRIYRPLTGGAELGRVPADKISESDDTVVHDRRQLPSIIAWLFVGPNCAPDPSWMGVSRPPGNVFSGSDCSS